ncbi:MAG: cysteine hydrolase family protein [Marinicellaceae bacterium]
MNSVALVSIDYQKGFDEPVWGIRNNPDAEIKMASLMAHWRKNNWPVIHVQHCSVEPDSPLRSGYSGNDFKEELKPKNGEAIFKKSVNSGFIGTDLQQYLDDNSIKSLVIAGLTTDHCVSTTTRMAGNYGYEVTLVSDATATFDRTGEDGTYYSADQIHRIHLASLNGEFCTVKTTNEVLKG